MLEASDTLKKFGAGETWFEMLRIELSEKYGKPPSIRADSTSADWSFESVSIYLARDEYDRVYVHYTNSSLKEKYQLDEKKKRLKDL